MNAPIPVEMCSCGRVLYEAHDIGGKRVGVTHIGDDEWHHMEYWSRPAESVGEAVRRVDGTSKNQDTK